MKIDIACPTYRGLMRPGAKNAMDELIRYSSCTCFVQNAGLAPELYEAARTGKKVRDLPPNNPFHGPEKCPLGKHDIHVISQVDACVIHWARNDLLRRRRKDADYVLFCDDDIVVTKDTLERLLSHKKDIVAGLCTKRIDPPEPVFRQWKDEIQNYGIIIEWPQGKLVEVDATGTGLIMISRKVIEEVALNYYPFSKKGDGFWFEFLRGPHGAEWGEDVSFCWKARRLGFQIFVDTSVVPGHIGDYPYGVNDYLCYQEAVVAAGGLSAYRMAEMKKFAAWDPQDRPQLQLEEVAL